MSAPTDEPNVDGAGAESAEVDGDDTARTSRARATSGGPGPVATVMAFGSAVRGGVANVLTRPLASFHLIVTLLVLMTSFGLVMVLSSSAVEGYSKEGSAYGMFTTQVVFALVGLVAFWFTVRMPIRLIRRLGTPALLVTIVLLALVLVPGIGTEVGGARRWFEIGGLTVQPSEFVKVALCVWGASLLANRRQHNATLRELLLPLLPVSLLVCVLIILEPNQSTTMTIAILVGALLWYAGLPIKVFLTFAIGLVVMGIALALVEGYRSQRVAVFLGQIDDPEGASYQARQAKFALANGGPFGVGLGQSRAKWNYLPNAHNDFIFAIIGEELGLIGGLCVLGLFALFAYTGFRIAMRSVDPFLRLMAASLTVLITAQALINIGYVVGLLPVTGIQLPLLSAGGTSILSTLVMFGLLANAARHEPEAVAALTHGGEGRFGRFLHLGKPQEYRPSRSAVLRDRLDDRRSRERTKPKPRQARGVPRQGSYLPPTRTSAPKYSERYARPQQRDSYNRRDRRR